MKKTDQTSTPSNKRYLWKGGESLNRKTISKWNLGFSLVEVLIAVAILVLVAMPLAMSMISSSQMNGRSKQISVSSDLSSSMIEIMQTVDLSDILADINGYSTDEYGSSLGYTITQSAFKDVAIGSTMEMIKNGDGSYTPVVTMENAKPGQPITSSIISQTTGETQRTYFVGQDTDRYAFLLKNVETEDLDVDILATINPESKQTLANINSMSQTEVIQAKQTKELERNIINQFKIANDEYIALKGSTMTIPSLSVEEIENSIIRTITVNIDKDAEKDAATISIVAEYKLNSEGLREKDRVIEKTLGTFSTNSTSEFARGIYVYYTYLPNKNNTIRDRFVIKNPSNLSTPVYLIAYDPDGNDLWFVNENANKPASEQYTPSIKVEEYYKSYEDYPNEARTTVCSNVVDSMWQKTLDPAMGRKLNIKSLGNATEQQTMYTVDVQIFRHNEQSYDENGNFDPRSKDLLVKTTGTFIDTSKKMDVEIENGDQKPSDDMASAWGMAGLIYNGNVQVGVVGNHVTFEGITEATDAGDYVAIATPETGYTWADGTTISKIIKWEIQRVPDADAYATNKTYNASPQNGVSGRFFVIESGSVTQAKDVGNYSVRVTPEKNHAWKDGTFSTKTISWQIKAKEVTIEWATGMNFDRWTYDGQTHYATCKINGLYDIDKQNCDAVLSNHPIKEVGIKTARVESLTNANYSLPTDGLEHQIQIVSVASAFIDVKNNPTYNGTMQNIIRDMDGVVIGGTYEAKEAGDYELIASLKDGFTWADGSVGKKVIKWKILEKEVNLQWGEDTWVYDGLVHSTTCTVKNNIPGDIVQVILKDNAIRDVGTIKAYATGLTNKNYKLPSVAEIWLHVTRAPIASYTTFDFDFDGYEHVGVTGQHIMRDGDWKNMDVVANNDGTVGFHIAQVTPEPNYAWSDGTYATKNVTWKIRPICDASFYTSDMLYSGIEVSGVFGTQTNNAGQVSAIDVGDYVAKLTPIPNHAWKDTGTMETRDGLWKIVTAKYQDPVIAKGEFVYDGKEHSPTLQQITATAGFKLKGTLSAVDVGEYEFVASLIDKKTTWSDGTKEDKVLRWKIVQRPVEVNFDVNQWTYNATERTATAKAGNLVSQNGVPDVCDFIYENNKRTHAGTQTFKVVGVTNKNYRLPTQDDVITNKILSSEMVIKKKTIAINWGVINFTYEPGTTHTVIPTIANAEPGDVVTLVPQNNTRSEAGSQVVSVVKALDQNGNEHNDYQINPNDYTVTMTVNRARLAKAIGLTRTYNEFHQIGVEGENVTWTGQTSATNAGLYRPQATPTANYAWSDGEVDTRTIDWRMNKAPGRVDVHPTKYSRYLYTSSQQYLLETKGSGTGVMEFISTNGTNSSSSWPNGVAGTGIPLAINAGWYTVFYRAKESENYLTSPVYKIEIYIDKAPGSVYEKPVNLNAEYNGNFIQICSPGKSNTGTMMYSIQNITGWGTGVPTRRDVGTYVVQYKAAESQNYYESGVGYVTCTIQRPIPEMAPGSSWYRGNISNKRNIEYLEFRNSVPSGSPNEVWDASSKQNRSVMAYRFGNNLYLVGDERNIIYGNPDSSEAFADDAWKNHFYNLKTINLGILNTSRVTTFSNWLRSAGGLNDEELSATASYTTFKILGTPNLDVSNATDLQYMFAKSGNKARIHDIGDISNWNVSKVTNMSAMFWTSEGVSDQFSHGDLGKWDMYGVKNIGYMFCQAACNSYLNNGSWPFNPGNIGSWDVSQCEDMMATFYMVVGGHSSHKSYNLSLNLNNWNVRKVKSMSWMMSWVGAHSTNISFGSLRDWKTDSLQKMDWLFRESAYNMSADISQWNVWNVTDYCYFRKYRGKTVGHGPDYYLMSNIKRPNMAFRVKSECYWTTAWGGRCNCNNNNV